MNRYICGNSQVHLVFPQGKVNSSALVSSLFCDVQFRHNLYSAGDQGHDIF